jgi:hypothetical protein
MCYWAAEALPASVEGNDDGDGEPTRPRRERRSGEFSCQLLIPRHGGQEEFGNGNALGTAVGGRVGRVEVVEELVALPTLPHAREPTLLHLVAVSPCGYLAEDACIGSDIREVVQDAVFRSQQKGTPSLVLA